MGAGDYIVLLDNKGKDEYNMYEALGDLVKKFDGELKKDAKKVHQYYVKVPEALGDGFKEAADALMLKKGVSGTVQPHHPEH